MCFDLLLPSSMLTSVCSFRFGLAWFDCLQNNVRFSDPYCTVCREYETRISNSVRAHARALMNIYIYGQLCTQKYNGHADNVNDCVYILNGKWRTKWHVIWSKHQIWSYSLYLQQNRTVCMLRIVQKVHPCTADNAAALYISVELSCIVSWGWTNQRSLHLYSRRNSINKSLMISAVTHTHETWSLTVQSYRGIYLNGIHSKQIYRQTMIVVRIIAALHKLHMCVHVLWVLIEHKTFA